jgi:hypothetical protein
MTKYFLNKSLLIRFVSLYIFASILCVIIWAFSFLFLPEGFLRDSSGAAVLAGKGVLSDSFFSEFGRIFLLNLILGAIPIIIASFYLSYNGYPLGWIIVPFRAVYFGLILGTNSFSIPLAGGKLAPTTEIFLHAGPYEIASYALIAAATCFLSRYDIRQITPKGKWESIENKNWKKVLKEQWLGIILGLLILVLSCAMEVYQILILG